MNRAQGIGGLLLLATSALSFAACSAGGMADEPAPEVVGTSEAAIGWSCGTSNPSKAIRGGFASRWVSPSTYSDCYKGLVVQVDSYDYKYAVGGYTKVSWGDEPLSLDECAEATVGAYLMRLEDGVYQRVVYKEANGDLSNDNIPSNIERAPRAAPVTYLPAPLDPRDLVSPGNQSGIWRPPGPKCTPPVVYFYAHDMPPGHYKIIASARTAGKVLHSVAFESVAGTCGQSVGAACCILGDACGLNTTCDASSKCAACGTLGKPACPVDDINYWDCQPGTVRNAKNTCVTCGDANQLCCDDSPTGSSLSKCKGSNTCNKAGICVPPPSPPPCGGRGEDCCSGDCDPGLSCYWGTCKTTYNPGGGPTCGAEGQGCTQGSCCATEAKALTCDPVSSTCKFNPNDSTTHRATDCDEPDEPCCVDLPQSKFGGCDDEQHPRDAQARPTQHVVVMHCEPHLDAEPEERHTATHERSHDRADGRSPDGHCDPEEDTAESSDRAEVDRAGADDGE